MTSRPIQAPRGIFQNCLGCLVLPVVDLTMLVAAAYGLDALVAAPWADGAKLTIEQAIKLALPSGAPA